MKLSITASILLLTTSVASQATTVVLNATAGGGGAEDSSGTRYTDGAATFRVGFFTSDGTAAGSLLSNAEIMALGANPTSLGAAFVELGSSTSFSAGADGVFGASFDLADLPDDGASGLPLASADYSSLFDANVSMYAYIESNTEVGVWDSGVGLLDPEAVSAFNFSFTPNFNGVNVTTVIGNTGAGVFFGESLQTTPIVDTPSCPIPNLSIISSGDNVDISWSSENGCSYQLQSSANLASWSDLGDPVAGDGAVKTLSVEKVMDAEFLRLAVQNP